MIPFPNTVAPIVNKLGRILAPFNFYLQQFTQAPPKIADITVVGSPFSYTAKEPGNVSIIGGATAILTRGFSSVDITGQKLIYVGIQDTITVTGSPVMKFLASYGQNTGNQ